ncbi:MAG: hypothetical protein FJ246_02015 [Nitrospira sp.]|nr:hypothetical protein [Nitrospira sp.]
MQLVPFSQPGQAGRARADDLARLLEQPTDRERRPCPNCDTTCGCPARSTQCCCSCSARCPDAPRFLSSEPARYPIEPQVLPLVYVLAGLRLVPPCWSCEGHLQASGGLTRLPQVWFYSASTVYPELIALYLKDLEFQKRLHHHWMVSVCPHAAGGATIFQIQPEQLTPSDVKKAELQTLQDDLRTIAGSLDASLRQLAISQLKSV